MRKFILLKKIQLKQRKLRSLNLRPEKPLGKLLRLIITNLVINFKIFTTKTVLQFAF